MNRIALLVATTAIMFGSSAMADTIVNIPAGKFPVINIKDLTEGDRWSSVTIYNRPDVDDGNAPWVMVYQGRAQKDYWQDTAITETRWGKLCPNDKGCQVKIDGQTGVGNGKMFDRGNVLPQNDDGAKTSRIDIEMYGPGEDRPSAEVMITFDKDDASPSTCAETSKPI